MKLNTRLRRAAKKDPEQFRQYLAIIAASLGNFRRMGAQADIPEAADVMTKLHWSMREALVKAVGADEVKVPLPDQLELQYDA